MAIKKTKRQLEREVVRALKLADTKSKFRLGLEDELLSGMTVEEVIKKDYKYVEKLSRLHTIEGSILLDVEALTFLIRVRNNNEGNFFPLADFKRETEEESWESFDKKLEGVLDEIEVDK